MLRELFENEHLKFITTEIFEMLRFEISLWLL